MAAVDDFIAAHRGGWEALERLIRRAGRDPRHLEAAEIEELGRLYRHVASDLALAQRDFSRDQATRYLNDLAARAHPLLYRATAGSWGRIGLFFSAEFPRLFRGAGLFILTAFLLFALPAAAGYLVVSSSPSVGEQFLPQQLTRGVRAGHLWTEVLAEMPSSVSSSLLMTHNIQVAILAFAGGILLGTLTAYVLVLNGLSFGVLFGYTRAYGLAGDLAAFVSPHGYVELTVVFIAGGAGLQMAWGIVNPGLLSRRDSLGIAARRAVLLLVGALPLLVVAGLLEGFVSPSALPRELKLAIGPLTALALYAFLLWRRS